MIARSCAAVFFAAAAAHGAGTSGRTNWFGDPYFQLSGDIAPCPEPMGPLVTEEEALRQSHHRSERGLRCYLENRCRHPSAFDYDRDIAEHIRREASRFVPHPSTLWALVQGRRVWIYGCVAPGYSGGLLERALRRIPDVELAMEEVRVGPRASVPYRTRH